jgi:hypothetical protein
MMAIGIVAYTMIVPSLDGHAGYCATLSRSHSRYVLTVSVADR